jgi:purine-binding chemotaxis protein CheW
VTPAHDPIPAAEEILQRRARALARTPTDRAAEDAVRLLVLQVGPEQYGVELGCVQEVSRRATPSPVPGAPPEWAGLVNVRGTLHWVLDLRRYLGLDCDQAQEGSIALASANGHTIGLLSDALPTFTLLASADVRPPPAGWNGSHRAIVRGVTPDLVSVLDLDALLNSLTLDAREVPS